MVKQAWGCVALLASLLVAGCGGRAQDYLDVFDEQRVAWNEVADTLATITDDKSMAAANIQRPSARACGAITPSASRAMM